MPRTSVPLTTAIAVLILGSAALTPLFALATGSLVGAIPQAVAAGMGSAQAGEAWRGLAAVGVVFVLQQMVAPLRQSLTRAFSRLVDQRMTEDILGAVFHPHGVAHLEEAALRSKVELAQGAGMFGASAGRAIEGFTALWSARLAGVGSLVLVARFRWWLALLLLGASVVTLRSKRQSFLNLTAIYATKAEDLRRAGYYRDLALGKDAAKEARVFGLSGWAINRFDDAWLATMHDVWRERRRGSASVTLGIVVKAATILAAYVVLAQAATSGAISLATFVVVAQALNGVSQLSIVMGNPELMIHQGMAAAKPARELEQIVRQEPRLQMSGAAAADGLPTRSIRFEGVRFCYPGRDVPVFDGLDLEITAGQSLGIVGENGAGKTTLVKLLARLYDPDDGRILVDDAPLTSLDPDSWHARLATIFQDFGQYPFTAEENVGLAALGDGIDRAAVERAAALAGVSEIVAGWEHGWATVLNRQFDFGAEVSGGQWQRIALARALFAVEQGASVLVLDEPTAQLDVRSEFELYDRFLEITKGLTTVVISHRFSTVRRADRIVVVEHGRVVESGSHAELLAAGGRYAEMFGLQAARFR